MYMMHRANKRIKLMLSQKVFDVLSTLWADPVDFQANKKYNCLSILNLQAAGFGVVFIEDVFE